jgi:hypothetical protein
LKSLFMALLQISERPLAIPSQRINRLQWARVKDNKLSQKKHHLLCLPGVDVFIDKCYI